MSKVRYWSWDGHQSTAYLDEQDEDGRAVGVDKYTDRPLSLMWDKSNEAWVELR